MSEIQISELNIYPLKSARGLSLSSLELAEMGPEGDRRWMLVDANGQYLSQRQLPKMCLIRTGWDGRELELCVPGSASLRLCALQAEQGARLEVQIWEDRLEARDCGDGVAALLSVFLDKSVRMVYMPNSCRRQVDPAYAHDPHWVSFADGFPLLLISEESLLDFNAHSGLAAVSMVRFRPNIVVRGCAPYAEDGWQRLRVAGVELELVKPCSRCGIPAIDPATGARTEGLARALASQRRRDGVIYFGQNLLVHGSGQLSVGDVVELL